MKRILIIHEGGFGSQIQMVGVWLDLVKDKMCDLFLVENSISEIFWNKLAKQYKQKLITENRSALKGYKQVLTARIAHANIVSGKTHATRRLKNQSEVKDNELIAKQMGVILTPVSIKWKAPSKTPKYDILICNGSLDQYSWLRKKYTRWNEVINLLKGEGYRVGCVGLPHEYIYGADDLTDLSMSDTLNVIAACRVFAANDTGLYHFACAINKSNVVLFTASSYYKNYDKVFHRYATVIRPDIHCSPCQGKPNDFWHRGPYWVNCIDWKCNYYSPEIVVREIRERL